MSARAALLLTTAALALAAIAVICGRATAAASSDPCLNSDAPATRLADEQYTDAIACLINRRRAVTGRRALTGSTQLQRAAVRHSADMVAGRFFSHTGPGRSTMVTRLRSRDYGDR